MVILMYLPWFSLWALPCLAVLALCFIKLCCALTITGNFCKGNDRFGPDVFKAQLRSDLPLLCKRISWGRFSPLRDLAGSALQKAPISVPHDRLGWAAPLEGGEEGLAEKGAKALKDSWVGRG